MKNRKTAWILAGVLGVGVAATVSSFVHNYLQFGTRTTSYPDGSPSSESQRRNGKNHGLTRRWTDDGALRDTVNFVDGAPCCGIGEGIAFISKERGQGWSSDQWVRVS